MAVVSMLPADELAALVEGRHADPFARLGQHRLADGKLLVRVLLPGASRVGVCGPGVSSGVSSGGSAGASSGPSERVLRWLPRVHDAGLFEGVIPLRRTPFAYRLRVHWGEGAQAFVQSLEDPYRFGPMLSAMELWLLGEGRHLRPYEALGAHPVSLEGVSGTRFVLWAPNARRVSVVGDFNVWDGRRHPMRLRDGGHWELFLPGVLAGERYKYELLGPDGALLPQKADPYGMAAELRPATASIVAGLPPLPEVDAASRQRANALDAPIAIYEVHLGSWRRKVEEGGRFLTWRELADELVPYVLEMGFTHIELLPVSEHPFDGSWGYQPIGLYAPTARFGSAQGLREFVQRCHEAGIGVLLDWAPAHFPNDAHGLARFDGTALYEHADPREGLHRDWDTLIYNFGRHEVVNFLVGNALYWIERFGVDGLRVDAVASMLYRDYSREPGQWVPNAFGGRENLEARAFVQRLNEIVGVQQTHAVMIAEESTAWPMVTRPPSSGGLGFHYKWNMGWMNDTLRYMSKDPVHRKHHQNDLSFGLVYAFDENFVLPLSHDEVVHGKGSLLARMPGDRWQKFANLRAYLGFMYAHPGKKLLFMGAEFAQEREWQHDQSLDWHLLGQAEHLGMQTLVRDLNRLYRRHPALHQRDCRSDGFEWIDHANAAQSVLAFLRRGEGETLVLVVCNFTPMPRTGYRVGVPRPGGWRELLNTDSTYYAGSNMGNPQGHVHTREQPAHGHSFSLELVLPPLATLVLEWIA